MEKSQKKFLSLVMIEVIVIAVIAIVILGFV